MLVRVPKSGPGPAEEELWVNIEWLRADQGSSFWVRLHESFCGFGKVLASLEHLLHR
jgi:hypothetical protein